MNQFHLEFNSQLARRLREEGISRVEDHADIEWKDAALLAVLDCARENEEFIVDAVWRYLPEEVNTHELRAMGPVMRRAKSRGWIFPTDRFIASDRISAHRNPRRVWISLL